MSNDIPRRESHAPEPPHAIPMSAVTGVWTRLSAVYGQRFLAQYDGVNLGAVKEDWRQRLAGLSPEQLQYAIDNLPGGKAPPDVLEFRRLAIAMPDERRVAALPPPRGRVQVPAQVREALAALQEPPPEPKPVIAARAYLARWEAEASKPEDQRVKPTPDQQEWIRHYRAVLYRHESRKQADAARQAADDARAAALGASPPPPPPPIEDRLAPTR